MARAAQITYREANRRYRRAYWPMITLYAVACIGGALIIKQNPPMWAVATIAIITAAPIIGVFWLMRRLLAETDEYTRKLHTEALLTGGGLTFSLTVVWSFFELYGVVPQDRYFPATLFIVPIFLGLYGLTLAVTLAMLATGCSKQSAPAQSTVDTSSQDAKVSTLEKGAGSATFDRTARPSGWPFPFPSSATRPACL